MNFAFWPAQASTLFECSYKNMSDAGKSYLCTIEACTLETLGCIGGCKDDAKQMELFTFLDCFEGKYFPWVTVDDGGMGDGYDDCLLHAVCGNYTGGTKPKDCVHQHPPKGC